jgi:hypothetical protein
MKRITAALLALTLLTVLLTACGITGTVVYEYKGFIIEIYENARGETTIVTISGDVESNFVIKENTKVSGPAKEPFHIGGCIMLNTTAYSDEYVKECKVVPGCVNEGRLVYVEGDDTPFLLQVNNDGNRLFVKLVDDDQNIQPGTSGMGDVIRVYHQEVIELNDPIALVEGLIYVENGSPADLTDEDVAFIISEGYIPRAE